MKIKAHQHWPYFGWDDWDARTDIKMFPNISIEIYNNGETMRRKLSWYVRIEWLIFSVTIY